jgi:hypothetical protein
MTRTRVSWLGTVDEKFLRTSQGSCSRQARVLSIKLGGEEKGLLRPPGSKASLSTDLAGFLHTSMHGIKVEAWLRKV